jgi:ABC-type transporter MlaC component
MPARGLRILLPWLAWIIGAQCAFADPSDASLRGFVDRLTVETMEIYRSNVSNEAHRDRAHRLLDRYFDVTGMALAALGPAWETASAAERRAFRAAFEERIINAFINQTEVGSRVSMIFVGARREKTGHALAATRLIFPERPEETWIWRLRPNGTGWLVVDLLINGRSTLAGEREEYARVLAFHHGNLTALTDFVRNRGR